MPGRQKVSDRMAIRCNGPSLYRPRQPRVAIGNNLLHKRANSPLFVVVAHKVRENFLQVADLPRIPTSVSQHKYLILKYQQEDMKRHHK